MRVAPYILICLYVWLCLPLHARDLAAYRVGDVANDDVIAPVALDVEDPAATAALKSAKARQFPAIFRSFPEATNIMARDFLAAFAQSRSNFLVESTAEFRAAILDPATIASPEFGRFVTAFGVENKNFPATDALAAEWARGRDGESIRDNILAALQLAANRPVQPDVLPKDMFVGETVRLVPVSDPEQKLSFDTVQQGQLVPAASLTTISKAQALFRRDFPAEQQLFARALAAFLQPNCFPDAPFTQLTRGAAVLKLVVSDHFDAGDTIVRQGDKIDAKIRAALDALSEKQIARPPAPPVDIATAQPPPAPQSQPPPPPPPTLATTPAPAPKSNFVPVLAHAPAVIPPKADLRAGTRRLGLITALAATSVAWLLVAWWQFSKQRKKKAATPPVAQAPLPFAEAAKDNLAPQVTQAVREAVQQELTMQRRELLVAQQAATSEIAALVHRLDELQVPMQQRLQTYESRIQALEKELALRNEENRELLKMKIEMVTRQLETERAATLVPPMAA